MWPFWYAEDVPQVVSCMCLGRTLSFLKSYLTYKSTISQKFWLRVKLLKCFIFAFNYYQNRIYEVYKQRKTHTERFLPKLIKPIHLLKTVRYHLKF